MNKMTIRSNATTNLYRLVLIAVGILLLLVTGAVVITASALTSPGLMKSSIIIVDGEGASKPTPASSIRPAGYRETDMTTIQKELPFTVLTPQNLPEGTTLTSVRSIDSRAEGLKVELTYVTPDGQFTLTESKPEQVVRVSVERSRVLQEVEINGQPGVIYDPGALSETTKENMPVSDLPLESRAILQWTDGTRWFEMRGNIGSTEMIKIAQSLAP